MRRHVVLLAGMSALLPSNASWAGEVVKVGIMQSQYGEAQKYKALATYLKTNDLDVQLVSFPNYPEAAKMFISGSLDAMVAGSAVGGIMILKGVAEPAVRQVSRAGSSTYAAVILARKGTPPFSRNPSYFKDKKVIVTAAASSGEFFFLSLPYARQSVAKLVKAANHEAAIDALEKGAVDFAIVKNHVWEKNKARYPSVVLVGKDDEQNPDGTLIVSKRLDAKLVEKIVKALLAVKADSSPEAKDLKDILDLREYTKTTRADFKHTLEILERAGVDASYSFQ